MAKQNNNNEETLQEKKIIVVILRSSKPTTIKAARYNFFSWNSLLFLNCLCPRGTSQQPR